MKFDFVTAHSWLKWDSAYTYNELDLDLTWEKDLVDGTVMAMRCFLKQGLTQELSEAREGKAAFEDPEYSVGGGTFALDVDSKHFYLDENLRERFPAEWEELEQRTRCANEQTFVVRGKSVDKKFWENELRNAYGGQAIVPIHRALAKRKDAILKAGGGKVRALVIGSSTVWVEASLLLFFGPAVSIQTLEWG